MGEDDDVKGQRPRGCVMSGSQADPGSGAAVWLGLDSGFRF